MAAVELEGNDDIQILPDDIPGSSFNNEEIGKLSVKQLQFWLKCRRIKQKGHKKELIERVRNLNEMPEIRNKVYDPDPLKAYTKAKIAKLKADSQGDKHTLNMAGKRDFPSEDTQFTKDFSVLPDFVPTDTLEHLKNCNKTSEKSVDGDALVDLSSSKGLMLLPFVHDLEVCKSPNSSVVFVRALCWASYRKSVKYKVKLIVNSKERPKILSAQCDRTCPAGKSGCCCHVMAVIWKLDDMTRNKANYKLSDNRACTSKPRKWGIPGRRDVDHTPVMESTVFKTRHQSDIPGKKRRGVLSTFFDPRPVKSRKLETKGIEELRDEVKKVNPNIPFAKMIPNHDQVTLVETVVGLVTKGSVLHSQLKDYMRNNSLGEEHLPLQCCSQNLSIETTNQTASRPNKDGNHPTFPIISPPKHNPTSLDEIRDRCERIKRKLSVDENEVCNIEKETRGQSDNPKWFESRFGRVTASKCHRIACPHRASTSPTKIVRDILNYSNSVQTKAMKEGIENEDLALSIYEKNMKCNVHSDFKVEKCGFFVSKKNGFVGASPDGLVTDPSVENQNGIVEVKNIQVNENESLINALQKRSICNKNGDLIVSHKYYYQIQQQLYVVNRPWCDFVVRGSNGELLCKRVEFNNAWWNAVFLRLESFYYMHVLPELAYPRARDGLKCYSLDSRST